MKKRLGNLLFFITTLMCVMVLLVCVSINSRAAGAGTLSNGANFNVALKQFGNSSCKSYNDFDYNLKKIIFTNKAPSGNFQTKGVGSNVTAYYDSNQKIVYIYSPSKIMFPAASDHAFTGLKKVESIDFNNAVDMRNIQDMTDMFYHCSSLKALDTTYFKNAKPTNMFSMFMGCFNLEQLDATNFNTSNVTTMSQLFAFCHSLKQLDVSTWNTSKVTDMHATFRGLEKVPSLNLSNFNTSNVKKMDIMFGDCKSLTRLDLRSFNTAKVTDMLFMFGGCSSLQTLDISSFDLSSIKEDKKIENFFSCCHKLKNVYAPRKIVRPLDYDYSTGYWMIRSEPIGAMILDDNNDGVADNSTVYAKLPVANKSHKYIVLKNKDVPDVVDAENEKTASGNGGSQKNSKLPLTVTIDGVTYTIGKNAKATVIKIDKVKKASLEKVTVQGVTYTVTDIAENACENNKKIKKLTIGSGVTSIGKSSFKGCKKLKKVTINANASLTIGKGAFKKINKDATIKVNGTKGKAKKKLVKAIRKQTNASVK
ncbi:BspA family leucine-rich repeat surface protein [Butyrivibrio sp. FC2001]|uniref:BspA family leucine-rich repeat surface protein n=1 Tax=Butyrivibrio sp. FC2001 TaxID=1280671 RepID=UPI000418620F|nr:BspA family leucine-rich repeat surface protein [Butyrivibrio sp. FC2001]